MKKYLWLLLCIALGHIHGQDNSTSKPLFNGYDLTEFEKLNGDAHYELIDGVIIGTSQLGTPNTFLATRQRYADFILDLEVYVDPRLNSGIQIRSQSKVDYRDGRVHGYQVEIDPSPRAYSGGIYDESRRGWLCPLARNEAGQKAFINGQWNKYHIEAIGPSIKVWINGTMTAYLIDDLDREGFIALQVHSIDDPDIAGAQVKWRNIKIRTSELVKHQWSISSTTEIVNLMPNTLSLDEANRGWRLLWDAHSLIGLSAQETKEDSILTKDRFQNFIFRFDFKISKGGEGGIKYLVDIENVPNDPMAPQLEYQIIDDHRHPDAKLGIGGNRSLAALYDLMAPTNLSVRTNPKPQMSDGQWNRGMIIAKDNRIEHWLNGAKVIEYDRSSQMFKTIIALSPLTQGPDFVTALSGHIVLESKHGGVVYKNLKIKAL